MHNGKTSTSGIVSQVLGRIVVVVVVVAFNVGVGVSVSSAGGRV